MGKEFPLTPERVPQVQTKYRRICTKIPVPESIPMLERMRANEPRSMGGQPPVVWNKGEGVCVLDSYGNKWLDLSGGVLVTSCGHGHPELIQAMRAQLDNGMYHAYCFPTEIREKLVTKLAGLAPRPLHKAFLLSTGAEAVECCLKLAMTQGRKIGGDEKCIVVSFENAFHGRTMGAQLAGGIPGLKLWLGGPDPRFVQVPYPDGFRTTDVTFALFERALAEQGIDPAKVCGVLSETYPGVDVSMWTPEYAQKMRAWCNRNKAVLILDEVQAGFGRTGKWFGFQHLGIIPDLIACGKGIAGGMPLSATIGIDELMDLYEPGAMTSTHSANPLCCAAAVATLETIEKEGLVQNAAQLEPALRAGASRIMEASQGHIGRANVRGLVAALQFVKPGTTEPDPDLAWEAVRRAVAAGVLLFAPVGVGGGAIKICPPLVINQEALEEALSVLRDVVAGVVA